MISILAVSCTLLYAPGIFYTVSMDAAKEWMNISGPRMQWHAPVSSFSNPEFTQYHSCWGANCVAVMVRGFGKDIQVTFGDGEPKQCLPN